MRTAVRVHDIMSDLWPFSASCPPPIMHHSSLASPFMSSPPPLSSPSSPGDYGHPPHSKVASYPFLPQTQVSSPQLPEPQVTSPHHLPPTQVTSLHLSHPQLTSPHIVPETQATSPHLLYQQQEASPHCGLWSSPHLPHPQVTSPHLPHPQVTSPHLPHPQVTSPHLPHPQVTSPHLPHPQVTSPHLPHPYVTSLHLVPQTQATSTDFVFQSQINSPHLLSPPQYQTSSQNHDPGVDHLNWGRAEPPSELSYLLKSSGHSCQNQSTAHLDLQLQNKNHFSSVQTAHREELENTPRLHYNTHTLLAGGVYKQGGTPGPVQDAWRPLGPAVSQLQHSPLGSVSGEAGLGRWSSVEFSSSPAEDSSSTQFLLDPDASAPQPFCSPNTPGPSPHYPQTPTLSSPGPQMHPREERLDFHTQTSRQLSRGKTLSCCLHEYDSHPVTSDPGQHHQHLTGGHLPQSQSELIQDQPGLLDAAGNSESCFPPQGRGQNVSSSAQSLSLPAGPSWREERGRGRGRGGGGGGQPDWTWVKQPRVKNTELPDCRLSCTVCKRDFRSLPALNGHMRSHSGSRSATWLNKGEDSSLLVPPSMPVTVPVQSGGTAKACRGGQKRCSRLSPATGGAVLYRSLLHLKEEEAVVSSGGDDEEAGAEDVHYTPPPMLCPLRAGPGLYCSLTPRRQHRVQTVQLHNTHNGLDDVFARKANSPPPRTLTTGNNQPRINVGRDFQAEIPPLRAQKSAHSDSHDALLLWTPWGGLELEHPANQQRVEALLAMARSSVVPGGGANPEFTLHVLSESRGDFLLTVEKLLSTPGASNNHRAQRAPSSSWSSAETRLLVKSLQLHHKDFSRIQKHVRTKSLSQCVEFYYLWKKKLSLRTLSITLPNVHGQRSSKMS